MTMMSIILLNETAVRLHLNCSFLPTIVEKFKISCPDGSSFLENKNFIWQRHVRLEGLMSEMTFGFYIVFLFFCNFSKGREEIFFYVLWNHKYVDPVLLCCRLNSFLLGLSSYKNTHRGKFWWLFKYSC